MFKIPLNIQRFASGYIESPGTKVSGGDYMYYRINWSSSSNGSVANSSNVAVDLYVRKGSYTTTGTWTGHINIGGNTSNFSHYASIGTSWVHVGSYSVPIGHNADGSKDCWIGAYVAGPSGTSAGGYSINYGETKTLDKIPRYANFTEHYIQSYNETSVTMYWNADSSCDSTQYSLNGGAWTGANWPSYTVSGLTPNTNYNIRTRIKRSDSQLWTESGYLYFTTYNYPHVTAISDFIVGNALNITIYNELNRSYILQLISNEDGSEIGRYEGNLKKISGFNDAETKDKQYKSIPNKSSGTFYAKVTYGSSVKNSGNKTYTINEEANNGEAKPTFNNFDIIDINEKTTALTEDNNKLILGYSIPQAIISLENKATANKYSSMSKYKMIVGEQTPVENQYSDTEEVILTNNLTLSSNEITVYATDTRGFSRGVTKTLNLLDYTIPTLNLLEAKLTRSNNNVGDQVTLSFDGTYWNKNFGAKQNSITKLTYKFKRTDTTEWSQEFDILDNIVYNEDVFSYEHLISGDLDNYGFDISESYDIIVSYGDELFTSSFNLILNSSTPNIAVAKTGNAMMMPYDEELGGALQVNGDIVLVNGKVVQENSNDTGVVLFENKIGSEFPVELTDNIENYNKISIDFYWSDPYYSVQNTIEYNILYASVLGAFTTGRPASNGCCITNGWFDIKNNTISIGWILSIYAATTGTTKKEDVTLKVHKVIGYNETNYQLGDRREY